MSRKSFSADALIEIGKRIKTIRGDKNQEEFAALLGVKRGAISNYEKGRRLPNNEVLEAIGNIGNTTVSWILNGGEISTDKYGDKYYEGLEQIVLTYKNTGFQPKHWISIDERAIIKLLRIISPEQALQIVQIIISNYESDPLIAKNDYDDANVKRLENIIEKGNFEQGIDEEGLISGYVSLKKSPEYAKKLIDTFVNS
ncbi:MAG: helix-turn-helix transcriptional regulator [Methylococcales bacterium]